MRRRVAGVLLALLSTFTLWFTMATPSYAIADDIAAMCGPFDVPAPQVRGGGLESFLGTDQVDTSVKASDMATYIPKSDEWPYKGPKPSYHRYGMAGLEWHAFGWKPGCFSMNRLANFLPNSIFNLSKIFALFTMALVGWSFGEDPFSFLQEPIANVAGAMSDVAAPFLGLVGALGGIYLGMKNLGPNSRVTAVFKGFGWMLLIAGLFFWFEANPTAAGSKINSIVGEVTATGYESLAELPSTGGADNTSLCNNQKEADAASCVQDALWVPLVYTPWLYGQVGNDSDAANKWGPAMLNAQFIGLTAEGKIDEDGMKVLSGIVQWNGNSDEVGEDSKSGAMAWNKHYVDKVPYLKLWANDLCHENSDHNFRMCFGGEDSQVWPWGKDTRQVKPEDENVINIASGNDFTARLSAAAMSVMGGIIINSSVYFICAMLLAAKLGVFTLMIFAPFYLLLGIFPGPSRVAAIKLGELFLTNLFRQVGWGLGLVIVTYMDTLILAPGGDQGWLLKILTCALMTVLLGVYAKPAMRALSGMAVGDKNAGDAIVGVGSNLAKQTAQLAGAAGLAVATGGASAVAGAAGASSAAAAAGQKATFGMRMRGAGQGVLKNAPGLGRRTRAAAGRFGDAKAAGKEGFENRQERVEERERSRVAEQSEAVRQGLRMQRAHKAVKPAHEAAMSAIKEERRLGNTERADSMEREYFESIRDPRGIRHPDDPLHPNNLRRSPNGGVDPERRVRPVSSGTDLMREGGLNHQSAAANLDRVLGMYDGAQNIDQHHAAGVALRALQVQIDSGGPHTEAARMTAANLVQQHGLPDRIDAVGLPANTPIRVEVVSRVAGELSSVPQDLNAPRDRMEFLQRVESLAQDIPVATTMSTALNELRGVLANMKAPAEQVEQALQNVRLAAGIDAGARNGSGGGAA
ncbi:hypothetical protein ACH4F6_21650 [Streptomyces sp. NPDC017936]|uniref:hypothetical protein n=1 Tax=Streptomyces sp. NPDC017936 TaxID=3365016 RepID=UPI0037B64EFA